MPQNCQKLENFGMTQKINFKIEKKNEINLIHKKSNFSA